MRRAAGAGDNDLEPGGLGAPGKSEQPVRGAVGGDDVLLAPDAERGQRFGGVAHGRPVRLASHDNGDGGGHAVNSFRESKNIGRKYKIGPRFGKAWQGVRNGLSCLGESQQASSAHFSGHVLGVRKGPDYKLWVFWY